MLIKKQKKKDLKTSIILLKTGLSNFQMSTVVTELILHF